MITRINPALSIAEVRQQALALQEAYQRGEEEAQRRFAISGAETNDDAPVSLESAQFALARGHGFRSWRRLVVFLLQHSPAEKENAENSQMDFTRLACLEYTLDDGPAKRARATERLRDTPTLSSQDVYHAACVGDVAALTRMLDDDPALANQRGGFFDWEPLMYACYSRVESDENSTLHAAQLLLDRGADPNPYFMWGGQYTFTALTGVFGEGESGPHNAPPHPRCDELAEMLLKAGADPNDSQALYNRMFRDGDSCLDLLLRYGLGPKDRCNWLIDDERRQLVANPQQTLQYQLWWALRHNQPGRSRKLIDHGADLGPINGDLPLYEAAMLAGEPDIADYLVEHGAERVELNEVARFACACLTGNESEARQLVDQHPDLVQRLTESRPATLYEVASGNRLVAMKLMIELGFDLDGAHDMTPLHDAAWNGRLDMVRLLVEHGANTELRDGAHDATPLDWARYNGQAAVVEFLESLAKND